jgi:hypothetical protein
MWDDVIRKTNKWYRDILDESIHGTFIMERLAEQNGWGRKLIEQQRHLWAAFVGERLKLDE